jgi:hypothetical protein
MTLSMMVGLFGASRVQPKQVILFLALAVAVAVRGASALPAPCAEGIGAAPCSTHGCPHHHRPPAGQADRCCARPEAAYPPSPTGDGPVGSMATTLGPSAWLLTNPRAFLSRGMLMRVPGRVPTFLQLRVLRL